MKQPRPVDADQTGLCAALLEEPRLDTLRPRKAEVVGSKINRADTIGLSVAAREEIASLATIPGSLPFEAALCNCRRILWQASERRDPGMTGTLGDCPAGRSQAALAA
jgi:hypothetical protein